MAAAASSVQPQAKRDLFYRLPEEHQALVSEFLPLPEQARCQRVSKTWKTSMERSLRVSLEKTCQRNGWSLAPHANLSAVVQLLLCYRRASFVDRHLLPNYRSEITHYSRPPSPLDLTRPAGLPPCEDSLIPLGRAFRQSLKGGENRENNPAFLKRWATSLQNRLEDLHSDLPSPQLEKIEALRAFRVLCAIRSRAGLFSLTPADQKQMDERVYSILARYSHEEDGGLIPEGVETARSRLLDYQRYGCGQVAAAILSAPRSKTIWTGFRFAVQFAQSEKNPPLQELLNHVKTEFRACTQERYYGSFKRLFADVPLRMEQGKLSFLNQILRPSGALDINWLFAADSDEDCPFTLLFVFLQLGLVLSLEEQYAFFNRWLQLRPTFDLQAYYHQKKISFFYDDPFPVMRTFKETPLTKSFVRLIIEENRRPKEKRAGQPLKKEPEKKRQKTQGNPFDEVMAQH